jgi:hypothetical protein
MCHAIVSLLAARAKRVSRSGAMRGARRHRQAIDISAQNFAFVRDETMLRYITLLMPRMRRAIAPMM